MNHQTGVVAEGDVLAQRVAALRRATAALDTGGLLRFAIEQEFAGRIALVSSFGAESVVLLDLVAAIDRSLPVIFLETGKLFPETLAYVEAVVDRLGLTGLQTIRPDPADLQRHDPQGTLWSLEPDFCCYLRKTTPLDRALGPFAAWITGRKRFHGGTRAALPVVEGDPATGRIKLNPLAGWSSAQIEQYRAERGLPVHPLVPRGFPSIGCQTCTRAVRAGESVRDGRWAWLDKSECGIHGEGI